VNHFEKRGALQVPSERVVGIETPSQATTVERIRLRAPRGGTGSHRWRTGPGRPREPGRTRCSGDPGAINEREVEGQVERGLTDPPGCRGGFLEERARCRREREAKAAKPRLIQGTRGMAFR
jgi:hypothetical protein